MESFNSIESCSSYKKSRRVRSWYLYEQYKLLEKSQSDAARKLRDKSYQDLILHQELQERRARRRLCDQFGLCHSESKLDKLTASQSCASPLSLSTNDFFESTSNIHTENTPEPYIYENIEPVRECDCEPIECQDDKDDNVTSALDYTEFKESNDTIKRDLQSVGKAIADDITLQFATVKENIECLEKYTKFYDDGEVSDDESLTTINVPEKMQSLQHVKNNNLEYENSIFGVWSKLVAFSYKIMQHHNGNLYYDYSTQFLTAVLACEIIRRGFCSMCYILQPYVAPVEFVNSELDITLNNKTPTDYKNMNYDMDKNSSKTEKPSACQKFDFCKRHIERKNRYRHRIENKMVSQGMSEPYSSVAYIDHNKKSTKHSHRCSKCSSVTRMVNSMLQLSRCIESVLQDTEKLCK